MWPSWAFGIDSFVECSAAVVMIWRLRAERDHRLTGERLESVEGRARRLVPGSLFLLAAYVVFDAVQTLRTGDRPAFSLIGVVLLTVSVAVMLWLAGAPNGEWLGSSAARPWRLTLFKRPLVGGSRSPLSQVLD